MDKTKERYTSNEYITKNPTWDIGDSFWKANKVSEILRSSNILPKTVCEVGCGAGKILKFLSMDFKDSIFVGYDIAPAVSKFWSDANNNITLINGDFFSQDKNNYDLILLLDVLEHVNDPMSFLTALKGRSKYLIIHFPLDLSSLSVLRESPLLKVRRKVGHIHYYTRGLALELLNECGFDVIDCQYTGAAFNSPQANLKTVLASIPRRIAYAINKHIGVRLFGGETIMVLVQASEEN